MRSWPLPVSLLAIAFALFAVPSRYEGAVLVPISPGHGLSLVDLAAAVPLVAAFAMAVLALVRGRRLLERTIRQAPWPAASALVAGGAGAGLLFASVFPFFWWWAIGATLLTLMLVFSFLIATGHVPPRPPEPEGRTGHTEPRRESGRRRR